MGDDCFFTSFDCSNSIVDNSYNEALKATQKSSMPTRRQESHNERPHRLPDRVATSSAELQPEDLLQLRQQAITPSADGSLSKKMDKKDERNTPTEQRGSDEHDTDPPLPGALRRGGVNSNEERGEDGDHSSQSSWEPLTDAQSGPVLIEATLVVDQEQATPTNNPLEQVATAPNEYLSESNRELVEATPMEDRSKLSQVHLVRWPLVWLVLGTVLLVVLGALGGVLATRSSSSSSDDTSHEMPSSSKELNRDADIGVTYHVSVYGVGVSDGSCENYSPGSIHVNCGSKTSTQRRITIVYTTGNIQCPTTSSEGMIECKAGNRDSGTLISGYILFSCTAPMPETESESDPVRATSRVARSIGQSCTANDKANVSIIPFLIRSIWYPLSPSFDCVQLWNPLKTYSCEMQVDRLAWIRKVPELVD